MNQINSHDYSVTMVMLVTLMLNLAISPFIRTNKYDEIKISIEYKAGVCSVTKYIHTESVDGGDTNFRLLSRVSAPIKYCINIDQELFYIRSNAESISPADSNTNTTINGHTKLNKKKKTLDWYIQNRKKCNIEYINDKDNYHYEILEYPELMYTMVYNGTNKPYRASLIITESYRNRVLSIVLLDKVKIEEACSSSNRDPFRNVFGVRS